MNLDMNETGNERERSQAASLIHHELGNLFTSISASVDSWREERKAMGMPFKANVHVNTIRKCLKQGRTRGHCREFDGAR